MEAEQHPFWKTMGDEKKKSGEAALKHLTSGEKDAWECNVAGVRKKNLPGERLQDNEERDFVSFFITEYITNRV